MGIFFTAVYTAELSPEEVLQSVVSSYGLQLTARRKLQPEQSPLWSRLDELHHVAHM